MKLVGYIHKKTKILIKPPKKKDDYFKLLITLEKVLPKGYKIAKCKR